jgi:two-component system, sensor histidine kinase PdtaS
MKIIMRLQFRILLRAGARLLGLTLLLQSIQGVAGDDTSRYLPRYPATTNARALFDSARATCQTDPRLSLQYSRRGLAIAFSINDDRLLATGQQLSGEAFFQSGANDSAESCYNRALAYAEKTGDDSLTAEALNSIGSMAYMRGNFALAIEHCNQALIIAQRAGDIHLKIRVINNLGLAARSLGNSPDDRSYFLLALTMAAAIRDTDGIAITLNHLGNSHFGTLPTDSAMYYYRKALALRQYIESNTNAIAVLFNNIGNVLRMERDHQAALEHYNQSLAISTRTGNRNLMATTYKNLAILARQSGDYTHALEYANRAKSMSLEIGLPRIAFQSAEQIARTLADRGEYRSAFDNLLGYIALKDSLDSQENRRRAADLQIRFESERKERQIQELELTQEKTIRDFLISVIGMTLVLGAVLIWLYREKSKAARETALQKTELEGLYGELVTKNARLEESESGLRNMLREKEVLLKEIHHRVKNNLQVVSSLLSLQSNTVDNAQTLELLLESQDRIRAMALVHERLYRSNDFAGIDVKGYLTDLVENLRRSYRTERLEVTVDCDPISVSIDTAIPLGLMVSELVTNAFKHGFPHAASGVVHVSARTIGNDECTLVVEDNGTGMPPGLAAGNASSLGLHLVNILVEQIDGRLTMKNNNGAHFAITFPLTQRN